MLYVLKTKSSESYLFVCLGSRKGFCGSVVKSVNLIPGWDKISKLDSSHHLPNYSANCKASQKMAQMLMKFVPKGPGPYFKGKGVPLHESFCQHSYVLDIYKVMGNQINYYGYCLDITLKAHIFIILRARVNDLLRTLTTTT